MLSFQSRFNTHIIPCSFILVITDYQTPEQRITNIERGIKFNQMKTTTNPTKGLKLCKVE